MLCTKCGKNEANIYFSRTINGEKTEHHLCPECAKEMDIEKVFAHHGKLMENSLFSSPFFSSAFHDFGFINKRLFDNDFFSAFSTLPATEKTCPYCGGTFEKFKETGKFGCAMCYETFKDKIDDTMFSHSKPAPVSKDEKIKRLKAKIDDAVKAERYEDAAKFRDEIKALENGK